VSWQLASFAVLGLVLFGGFAWYERSRPPSQIVALVAALAALAVAGRLVLAAIPNVVATTDIVIFSGYALGAAPGFAVGALAGLISNFWLGQGPWTPWQMAGWGLAGVLGAALARATGRRAGRIELTMACGFAGIAYGALLNFSLMVSYGGEFTLDRWLTLEARAVPFDLAHAIGNVTLALVAGPAMVRMLMRFRERFEFRWRGKPDGGTRPGLTGATTAMLVVLLTVFVIAPTPARAKSPAAAWLLAAENRDGGFSATPGKASSTQMTGWAMLGLEAAGINPLDTQRPTPVSYLRRNVKDLRAATDLALAILALEGAGVDTHEFGGRDLVSELAAKRRRNGAYEGWPNPTAFAIMALRGAGAGGRIDSSLAWLRRVQGADGGWGSVPGGSSDPDSTGAVLEALSGSRGTRRGVRFLRHSQHGNGGWALAASGPTNSQSTAWAVQGLLAAGVDAASVRRHGRSGLDYLAARRAPDGHYRYSSSSDQAPVWVTAQVLAAVALKPFPLAPVPRSPSSAGGSASSRDGDAAGEGAPHPSLTRHSREGREGTAAGESARSDAKRSGGATAPPTTTRGHPRNASATTSPADAAQGDSGEGGGPSPLIPLAIAVGAAGLVAGGTWVIGRRMLW
jgi:energy-coupling factor transport system substrate-specific component